MFVVYSKEDSISIQYADPKHDSRPHGAFSSDRYWSPARDNCRVLLVRHAPVDSDLSDGKYSNGRTSDLFDGESSDLFDGESSDLTDNKSSDVKSSGLTDVNSSDLTNGKSNDLADGKYSDLGA